MYEAIYMPNYPSTKLHYFTMKIHRFFSLLVVFVLSVDSSFPARFFFTDKDSMYSISIFFTFYFISLLPLSVYVSPLFKDVTCPHPLPCLLSSDSYLLFICFVTASFACLFFCAMLVPVSQAAFHYFSIFLTLSRLASYYVISKKCLYWEREKNVYVMKYEILFVLKILQTI